MGAGYDAPMTADVTPQEKRHRELSARAAEECIVLLEDDGSLPIRPGRIALYGVGARHTVKGGTGSGDVNSRDDVTVEMGLESLGFEVATKGWLDRFDEAYDSAHQRYLNDYVPARAKELGIEPVMVTFLEPYKGIECIPITPEDIHSSDTGTAVFVLSRLSGEGSDRKDEPGDYRLTSEEIDAIRTLSGSYDDLILVLNIGGMIDLRPVREVDGVSDIVLMGQLGTCGGEALAKVLAGEKAPSGKLVDTWAVRYGDYPASATFSDNDGITSDEWYSEGIFVGYRYFDSFGVEPMYPFGYGCTYSTFDMSVVDVIQDGRTIRIDVDIANTGDVAGRQVVQAYASQPSDASLGAQGAPYQKLVSFAKSRELQPGEEQRVTMLFDLGELASYSERDASWVLCEGVYGIRVGSHSRNTVLSAKLEVGHPKTMRRMRNLFTPDEPIDEIVPPRDPDSTGDVPGWSGPSDGVTLHATRTRMRIDLEGVDVEEVSYGSHARWDGPSSDPDHPITLEDVAARRATLEELVAQLTVEEMATLCVGTARSGGGMITGISSKSVPGAAGDTSAVLEESLGIRGLVMADGPAGLRLQPVYKTDLEGNLLSGGELLGDTRVPFDPKYDGSNSIDHFQYCTAIPVGWSLAQSWDPDVLEDLGRMVGSEMEEFGVDIWLAPALNIHRDPLCGRNFEYYSEDPLISGAMASAMVRGVQSHPGKGCCIKHVAANNQEDNRYFSSSWVSERTMREIYCRGFEIAIQDGHPFTAMASYNLLNGIHTANRYDLMTSFMRDECGFDGFVMTDWYSTQYTPGFTGVSDGYPIASSVGCIHAGCDDQQPGCEQNIDDIVAAVEDEGAPGGVVKEADTDFQDDEPTQRSFTISEDDLRLSARNIISTVMSCSWMGDPRADHHVPGDTGTSEEHPAV